MRGTQTEKHQYHFKISRRIFLHLISILHLTLWFQCRSVKITIMGEEGVPVQVDGEAWVQAPGYIRIVHKNRAQMLTRDKVRRRQDPTGSLSFLPVKCRKWSILLKVPTGGVCSSVVWKCFWTCCVRCPQEEGKRLSWSLSLLPVQSEAIC